MTAKIHFYFDFISPYSYFAWLKLPALAEKYSCEIKAHPIVFGKLLDKWGQLGPAEIPPKQSWLHQYCLRYAALNGFEYNPPKAHPFNPLAALRMSLKEVSGNDQFAVIDALFKGGWSQGADLGDLSVLISLVTEQSINGEMFSQKISESDIKNLLINETNNAIEKGVFGVPTIIIDDNLFWGNDQMNHIELLLDGKDPLDKAKLNQEKRPRAIDRKAFKKQNKE
jgi:2-hydroxychromene-2-carboxylate isomerase|tara:strand:+ start:633 stop:1307 length:675 start_codon:yes stop_codon:yes gene_type:complete